MSRPTIALIAAMARNRVIGRDNRLPWRIPDDMRHFRRLTLGKPVIVGRKNYESIGRPLPDRLNIVLTRQPDFVAPGAVVAHDVEEAIARAGPVPEIMIIGGAEIYSLFLPLAERIYLTVVDAEIPGDTFFPPFEGPNWLELSRASKGKGDATPYPLTYLTYQKRR